MIPSNLYASRIYSEHPVGLWSIDDDLSYLSLIDDNDRKLTNWTTSGSVVEYLDFIKDGFAESPFPETGHYKVSGNCGSVDRNGKTYYYTDITSQQLFNMYTDLNKDQRVFCINTYILHWIPASFYEIGYTYNNGTNDIVFVEEMAPGPPGEWVRIGKTFNHTYLDLSVKIVIRVYFETNTNIGFLMSGLSVGQWSETRSGISLGANRKNIPASTGLSHIFRSDLKGVELREYGPGYDTGYAIVDDNRLLAINGGIPLVYGSDSVTSIYPSLSGLPGIVVPGKGFLNNAGRYNTYTLEAWVRLDCNTSVPRKIIGPVASSDGIYVTGNAIAISINGEFKSYCVGEWYRPMLLHWIIQDGYSTLMINGESVIVLPIDQHSLLLPTNRVSNEDWVGIYGWSDVGVEIDTISIFPYVVQTAVAKRRFVWGQGVESPETINAAYLGTPINIDFAYSRYPVNYSYPETARWDIAQYNNLNVSKTAIKSPNYKLPAMNTGRRSQRAILDYSRTVWSSTNGATFITFSSDQVIDPCNLYFDTANIVNENETIYYGVFSDTNGPLITFHNKVNGHIFQIRAVDQTIQYLYNGTLLQTVYTDTSKVYTVGVDIRDLPKDIASFFAVPSAIDISIGGYLQETFMGRIYRFGIMDDVLADSYIGSEDGILVNKDYSAITSSYTLVPYDSFGTYHLDIDTVGWWEQVIPMSYFENNGKIDFMQYNIAASDTDVKSTVRFIRTNRTIISNIHSIVDLPPNGMININHYDDFLLKSFEIKNGSIIIPKKYYYADLSMILNLHIEIHGLIANQFMVKDMSISSFSDNCNSFKQIGTTHGYDIAPYTKVGNYYSNNITTPWKIYRKSTPYLFLTKDSGICPVDNSNEYIGGLWTALNANKDSDYGISALQVWLKYDVNLVNQNEFIDLMEIRSDNNWIKVVGVNDGTNSRIQIKTVYGDTYEDYVGVRFHQDGHQVVTPYLQKDKWTALGIDFEPILDMSNDIGGISLLNGCVFNNLVFYRTSDIDKQYHYTYRTWGNVVNDGTKNLTWNYWKSEIDGTGCTWDQVCKSATKSYGISIDEIYRTYVGTNRFVVDEKDTSLMFIGDPSSVISSKAVQKSDIFQNYIAYERDPKWQTISIKPA